MRSFFNTLGTMPQPQLVSFFADLSQQLGITHWNSLKDNPQAIEKLDTLGLGITHKNDVGSTLLHYAFKLGNIDLIEALIGIGFDINIKNKSGGYTMLHYAAMGGHIDVIKSFKNRGLNILEKCCEGGGLAHLAVRYGHIQTLPALKDLGLDLYEKDNYGSNLAHLAVRYGHIQTLPALKDLGLDLYEKDNYGSNLAHYAVRYGHIQTLPALKDLGLNLYEKDNQGRNLAHLALMYGHIQTFPALKDLGLNLYEKDSKGANLAHYAVRYGHLQMLPVLKDMDFDLHEKDKFGAGLMHYACATNDDTAVEALIRKGWDVNIQDADEKNILIYAVYFGYHKLIATLIKKYGFKPTVKDKFGHDILYFAQQGKNQETIDFCTDTTHLNQLYHDYLTSFIIPVIPLEAGASVVIDIMAQYAAPMERQAILERQIEQCLKERLVILQALIQFCDSPANENDAVARDILNKLLGERNLTLKKIEENLDSLLAEKEIQGKKHYYPLLLCRLEAVKYTGNLPTASENILYMQAQLALEKQNNPTLQDSYHKFQSSHKTLQDSHHKLQFSYNKLELSASFYFDCLLAFSCIGVATLAVGIIASCILTPIGIGIALTTLGTVSSGLALYGLYKGYQSSYQKDKELEVGDVPEHAH